MTRSSTFITRRLIWLSCDVHTAQVGAGGLSSYSKARLRENIKNHKHQGQILLPLNLHRTHLPSETLRSCSPGTFPVRGEGKAQPRSTSSGSRIFRAAEVWELEMSEMERMSWGSQTGPRPVLSVTGQECIKAQGKTLCTHWSSTRHVKLREKSFSERGMFPRLLAKKV